MNGVAARSGTAHDAVLASVRCSLRRVHPSKATVYRVSGSQADRTVGCWPGNSVGQPAGRGGHPGRRERRALDLRPQSSRGRARHRRGCPAPCAARTARRRPPTPSTCKSSARCATTPPWAIGCRSRARPRQGHGPAQRSERFTAYRYHAVLTKRAKRRGPSGPTRSSGSSSPTSGTGRWRHLPYGHFSATRSPEVRRWIRAQVVGATCSMNQL